MDGGRRPDVYAWVVDRVLLCVDPLLTFELHSLLAGEVASWGRGCEYM